MHRGPAVGAAVGRVLSVSVPYIAVYGWINNGCGLVYWLLTTTVTLSDEKCRIRADYTSYDNRSVECIVVIWFSEASITVYHNFKLRHGVQHLNLIFLSHNGHISLKNRICK